MARYAREAVQNYGHASQEIVDNLYEQGYSAENLMDIILVIADKVVTNYYSSVAQVPIDFPAAPALQEANV